MDPPRAGLHKDALKAIRNTLAIKKLVYISCDAKNAMKNFVDLSRAPSGTAKGDPFLPVRIIPVDLFPHTRGFELVILFERVAWGDILNTEIAKRIRWGNVPLRHDLTQLNLSNLNVLGKWRQKTWMKW